MANIAKILCDKKKQRVEGLTIDENIFNSFVEFETIIFLVGTFWKVKLFTLKQKKAKNLIL